MSIRTPLNLLPYGGTSPALAGEPRADPAPEIERPPERVPVEKGQEKARIVHVDDRLAREPKDQPPGAIEDPARPSPYLRLVPPDPEDLGGRRLGRELRPGRPGQLLDLPCGTCVDAVEDRRPEGRPCLVGHDHGGGDRTEPDAGDPPGIDSRPTDELPADREEIAPPDQLWVVLDVPRLRDGDEMLGAG